MKHRLLIIGLILACYNIGFTQQVKDNKTNDDNVNIEYNARTGIAKKYPTYEVRQNGYIIFEIKDINLFRYSVTLTELQNNVINSTRLSEGNTQINIDPVIFNLNEINLNIQVIPVTTNNETKALFEIAKEKTDKEKLIERKNLEIQKEETKYLLAKGRIDKINEIDVQLIRINAKLSSLNSLAEDIISKEQKNEKEDFEKQKQNIETDRSTLDLLNNIANDKLLINTYETTTKDNLLSQLNTLKDELAVIEHNYAKKVLDDNSNNTRFKDFNSALEAYTKSLAELNEITDFYQRLISILYSDQSFEQIKSEKDKLSRDFFQNDNIQRDDILKYCYNRLRIIDVRYSYLAQAYSLVSDKSDEAKEIFDKAKEIFDKISAFNSQIKTNSYHTFFLQIAKVYDAINETNFTLRYQTLILSDNADLINFNLNAQPHSNLPASVETKPINFKYDVKINGGVKIDVSTGVFWNLGLNDNSYRFKSQTDNTTLVIKEGNKNQFTPSFGLLFNIYRRSNKDVKLGGNFGFSTNSEKLNYYLGGSILFGKSERLNINFGLAGAQVKTVSDLYYTDDIIPVPIADLPNEVPLRNPSPFKVGFYFGISFNLLGTKNKETLSQISTL